MARIEINDLTKEFGTLMALDNVSLELEKGQIVGLLGPNGSGKTTLIKLMNGLLTPTEGTVMINGMEPGVGTKKVVAYLPDGDLIKFFFCQKGSKGIDDSLLRFCRPAVCFLFFHGFCLESIFIEIIIAWNSCKS